MSSLYQADHEAFRGLVRQFIEREMRPNFERWERDGLIDRDLFNRAGAIGVLGFEVPEQHGGGGVSDFRFNAVLNEELHAAGVTGAGLCLLLHTDIVMPYFLELADAGQQARWLPGISSGELVTAVAMTEPGAGSDVAAIATTAERDGDHYVVNGAKTFITNATNADLIVAAVRTGPGERHKGLTLLVVEGGMPGLERGPQLDKLGLHSEDTGELFFAEVRVPVANRLGEEGEGFVNLMRNLPRERLSIAVSAVASAKRALDLTVSYCNERHAFGSAISGFQNTRFRLAELATEVEIGRTFVDDCVRELLDGLLTAERAAMAKWWCTEMQKRAVDVCMQLHGGYGYMREYPIAQAYMDARVTTIYGGTTEIMKEIIGRSVVANQ
ncbi:MAG: acyl-CoA dehydrogenase family protein [Microthrixaceae bacterium]